VSSEPPPFSLVAGGPLFRLLRRLHLVNDEVEFLSRRILVAFSVAWIPLAVLAIFEGRAWGASVPVPFFYDIDLHARVLLGLPLMLGAERIVFRWMRSTVPEFLRRGLIPELERPRFDAAVASALKWRDSFLAETWIFLFVYFFGVLYLWRYHLALPMATWYAIPSGVGYRLTAAGWWYTLITVPTIQFLLLRWYYRIVVWARLLWQISRLDLPLIPTHPDRCGGLGFLATAFQSFGTLVLAQGVFVAGTIANRIFFAGAKLGQFQVELAFFTLFELVLVLGPALVFSPSLIRAKRSGRRDYGGLAEKYIREFDRKWLRGGAAADQEMLGSSDIQSLADMANSYEQIRRLQWVPFNRGIALELGFAALVPVAPLLLTMYPVEAIIDHVVKLIF
jgi:hypothetical protein